MSNPFLSNTSEHLNLIRNVSPLNIQIPTPPGQLNYSIAQTAFNAKTSYFIAGPTGAANWGHWSNWSNWSNW